MYVVVGTRGAICGIVGKWRDMCVVGMCSSYKVQLGMVRKG